MWSRRDSRTLSTGMYILYERQREILQNKTNKLIGITKPSIEIFLTREGQDTETHKKILEL